MLTTRVEFLLTGGHPLRDTIKACVPHMDTWRKLFSRRYTHHSEMLDVLDKVENVNETVYSKFSVSDPSSSNITKLLPNLRCSA